MADDLGAGMADALFGSGQWATIRGVPLGVGPAMKGPAEGARDLVAFIDRVMADAQAVDEVEQIDRDLAESGIKSIRNGVEITLISRKELEAIVRRQKSGVTREMAQAELDRRRPGHA